MTTSNRRDHPDFFSREKNQCHGTKKIHKQGDHIILVNQVESDWPASYAIYHCTPESIDFLDHANSLEVAEAVAALDELRR